MRTALAAAIAIPLIGSCSRKAETALVVGVQTDEMGQIVGALHIVVTAGGKVAVDETVLPPHGSRVGFPAPWEKMLTVSAGDPLDVHVDALSHPGAEAPLIRRLASLRVPEHEPGTVPLLRVQLESRCIVYPPPAHPSKIPGPISAPTCSAPETCIRGACQSDVVPAASLEPFVQNWPASAPDLCKPRDGGAPFVQPGTGHPKFAPLVDGQVLEAEAGPQGGHHIWLGLRMKNLRQAGSITKISAVEPGTGTAVVPSAFAFTYDPDPSEAGSCTLEGLRYQLDTGGIDYLQFLGKPLDVTMAVTDRSGATATTKVRVQIAPTLHSPEPTPEPRRGQPQPSAAPSP